MPPVCTCVIDRDELTVRNKEYLSVPAAAKLPDTWGRYVKPNIDLKNLIHKFQSTQQINNTFIANNK
jgi:hypothetical protein